MKLSSYIITIIITLISSISCSSEKIINPNIWVTSADLTSGKPIDGYYVYFKTNSTARYDLVVSSKPLVIINGQLSNEDDVYALDSIELYISPNQWMELNHRKDSNTRFSYVRSNLKDLIEKYPVVIEFYGQNGKRKSLYLVRDAMMKKMFFPMVK